MANMEKMLDKAYEQMEFADLVNAPVDALSGVSAADAEALQKAFGIKTVGDLGRNKYFLTAQAIVAMAAFR